MKTDTLWYKRMLAKFGTPERISEVMAGNGRKGVEKRKASDQPYNTGVTYASKEQRAEWGSSGGKKRWASQSKTTKNG